MHFSILCIVSYKKTIIERFKHLTLTLKLLLKKFHVWYKLKLNIVQLIKFLNLKKQNYF